jgi:DUF3014 family protein
MNDLPDYELVRTKASPAPEPERGRRTPVALWIAAILVVVAAFAAFFYSRRSIPAPPQAAARPAEAAPQAVRPLGGEPEAVTVPPLDESDDVVRTLVRAITSYPDVITWLATTNLIRNFTVVVANVADGSTPARHLRVLTLKARFVVATRAGRTIIDPRSYDRYDSVAGAAASIDPAGAARVYGTLKPRIGEAYAELGMPPDAFDRALERAIVALLQTPAVDGPIPVEPQGGTGYRYADPKLENLTAAQKQLLRAGPRNVRLVQSSLRRLAEALGIPPERLR